jgi:organic hydroperoxide reductase OsmC/OhrA
MATVHKYQVRAKSTRPRSGVVACDVISHPIIFSAPPEFSGEPHLWTPEHFFVAALVSCYVATFSGMSEFSLFRYVSLEVTAEGTLERDAGGWRFTEVRLSPSLKIAREEDREQGLRLLEKAERTCLVARSITAQVTLEPTIEVVPEVILAEPALQTQASRSGQ